MNKVEEVLKLKQLLDSGHINQDDFEKLKSEIFENDNNPKKIEVNKTSNNKIIILSVSILFLCTIVYFLVNGKSFRPSNNENEVQDSTQVDVLINDSKTNQQTEKNKNSEKTILKSFIGEWRTSIGEYVTIKSNTELLISNSVCGASLTCDIKNNELILFFNSAAGKLNNDYSYLTNKEIGKCNNKNNNLYIEFTNEDLKNGMGFSGGKLLSELEFYNLNE